jgi:hypothetical protein
VGLNQTDSPPSNWNALLGITFAYPSKAEFVLVGGIIMEVHQAGIFNNQLLHSLGAIQAAKTQLRVLTTGNSTPTVLVSQIGLCEILLGEIRSIRSLLERRLGHQRSVRRSAIAAKRNRSDARPIVQQRNLVSRSRHGN